MRSCFIALDLTASFFDGRLSKNIFKGKEHLIGLLWFAALAHGHAQSLNGRATLQAM